MNRNKKFIHYIMMYGKILLGCMIYAAGFQYLTYPNGIVAGGITGISMIVNLFTGFPVGVMLIIMNIPLFLIAWKQFGLRFIVSSLIGMLLSSSFIDLMSLYPVNITSEPLLAAVYGGIIKGLGCGIVYSTGATTGGIDIAAKFLRKRFPYVNYSTMILMLDVVVILAFALFFKRYDSAMYAAICIFIMSKVIDFVLYGGVTVKSCFIISDASGELKTAIAEKLGRGVTLLYGKGAFAGNEKQVILCAIKRRQIVALRKLVREIDEHAFMIISDARQVFGSGFGDINKEET